MESERFLQCEGSAKYALDVLRRRFSERQLFNDKGEDLDLAAAAEPLAGGSFGEFDAGLANRRLRAGESAPSQPRVHEKEQRTALVHGSPSDHVMIPGHPERDDKSFLALDFLIESGGAFRCPPPQDEPASRIVESRQKMIEKNGPDDPVDPESAEDRPGVLADGHDVNGNILDDKVAEGQAVRPSELETGLLSSGERAHLGTE